MAAGNFIHMRCAYYHSYSFFRHDPQMVGRYVAIVNDYVVGVGTADGNGERGETTAAPRPPSAVQNFDENYSLHETESRYHRTMAFALS